MLLFPKKYLKLLLITLFISTKSVAQEADFESFLSKFPKTQLPYNAAYQPNEKFNKALKISKSEAETWLTAFKSPAGHNVNLYEALIEPFGPTKNPEGEKLISRMKAEKKALLRRTEEYVLVVIRVSFLEKVADYSEGERYLLHCFTPEGQPISVLWIAQRIQFDLFYNQISSRIDESGNIVSLSEVFAPSDNSKREEKYRVTESGVIEAVKE
jgi:hypothetical protein